MGAISAAAKEDSRPAMVFYQCAMFSLRRWRHSERPSVPPLFLGLLVRTRSPSVGARPNRWGVGLVLRATCVFYCCSSSGGGLRGRLTYPRRWCKSDGFPVFIAILPFTTSTHDGSWAWPFASFIFLSQLDLLALPPSNPAHSKGGHRSWLWKDNGRGWRWRGAVLILRGDFGNRSWLCHSRLRRLLY